jgi:hypothetical protein
MKFTIHNSQFTLNDQFSIFKRLADSMVCKLINENSMIMRLIKEHYMPTPCLPYLKINASPAGSYKIVNCELLNESTGRSA